jgi:hypothetical protein
MQSTINFALANAFAKLNLSSDLADRTIAYLWRPITPPKQEPNIDKLNRQHVQRFEQMGGTDPKAFLTYLNNLSPDAFKAVSPVEHMEDFLQPQVPPEDDDEYLAEVSYHLRTYDVGVKTHRVYELRGGVHVFVGMLGMNEFKGMVMPELE